MDSRFHWNDVSSVILNLIGHPLGVDSYPQSIRGQNFCLNDEAKNDFLIPLPLERSHEK